MQINAMDARTGLLRQTGSVSRVQRAHCRTQQLVRCEQNYQSKRTDHRTRLTQLSAGALVAQEIACVGAAQASEAVSGISEATGTIPLALGGGAAIAALSAALLATDPQKRYSCILPLLHLRSVWCRPHRHGLLHCRRTAQTATAGGNEKDAVRSYFNTNGFERWNRIYGTTDDVNKVHEAPCRDTSSSHASCVCVCACSLINQSVCVLVQMQSTFWLASHHQYQRVN